VLLQTAVAESYELKFRPADWKITPSSYYISSVIDERENKNTGTALVDNKQVPVQFGSTLEDELFKLLSSGIRQDTTLVPLIFAVKKFELKETGTTANHKASFDFSFVIYREIDHKKYQLYESKGMPVLTMRGAYANPHERNIAESLKNVMTNFNDWLNSHPDLPPMARSVNLIFENPQSRWSDTLLWNPDYRLKWSDFKGTNINGPYMAQSNCLFYYKVDPRMNNGVLDLHVNLSAGFEKNHSWVKNDAKIESLLAHEQLHFDICEMHIRRIIRTMKGLNLNPVEFDSQFKNIFEAGWKSYQDDQALYDSETQHGIVSVEQKRWENKIRLELEKGVPE
jgi:hypothetical protein